MKGRFEQSRVRERSGNGCGTTRSYCPQRDGVASTLTPLIASISPTLDERSLINQATRCTSEAKFSAATELRAICTDGMVVPRSRPAPLLRSIPHAAKWIRRRACFPSRPFTPNRLRSAAHWQSYHSSKKDSVNPKVINVANMLRARKENGPKFVLMLGAGASMSSGVKRTPDIMQDLVRQFGNDLSGKLEDKFDVVWKRTQPADRQAFLKPLLNHTPSPGYAKLAELIDARYFDVALSFNFDNLLEQAFDAIDFTDFKRIIRGETIDEQMEKLLDTNEPRFKLLKLHGSLTSTDRFFFDVNEMNEYPPTIKTLLEKVTGKDLIVCGYSFSDVCVLRAFAKYGGAIVCVNPSGPPRALQGFLTDRGSLDFSINAGFDDFFDELHRELLVPKSTTNEKAPPNPFKFLESYEADDRVAFSGRAEAITAFSTALETAAQRIIVVAGPAKAGKTSLLKAGLIPTLNEDKYRWGYVRCQAELAKVLAATFWPDDPAAVDTLTVRAALERLGKVSSDRRVVLFLDQFERAAKPFDTEAALTKFLNTELIGASDNVTLVLVIVDEPTLVRTLYPTLANRNMLHIVPCPAFDRSEVAGIIQSLASAGGFQFDQKIIEDMLSRYESGKDAATPDRFTLAHFQALCHILAATRTIDYESYTRASKNALRALDHAINVCDFISFVEDLSWSDAVWFRNMVKVPLKESKDRIAEFIRSHYKELVPDPGARAFRSALDARGTPGRPA
jgi:hypothetical protein